MSTDFYFETVFQNEYVIVWPFPKINTYKQNGKVV